jgi:hypothetical protein
MSHPITPAPADNTDASTWPSWTDAWRFELAGLCPLCGEPAEPEDLARFGCCMWCRAGAEGDAEPGPYRYTLAEFERVARVASRPHVD